MNNEKVTQTSGGIGFLGVLAILFIALKLTGYIGWSWWWVLAPIWIPTALVVLLIAIFIVLELTTSKRRHPKR